MKSIVGLILGVIGSIGNLIAFLFFSFLFIVVFLVKDVVAPGSTLSELSGTLGLWSVLLAIWFFVFAILGFIYSSYMNKDYKVKKGGVGCLIFGFLTINIFLIIAGIMGLIASKSSSRLVNKNVVQDVVQSNNSEIETRDDLSEYTTPLIDPDRNY